MARQFTVDEANTLLPSIVPQLETLRDLVKRLMAVREQLDALGPQARGNGQATVAMRLEIESADLMAKADGLLRGLLDMGVEVKDPIQGLIDFRSLRDGREVYLCWRLGEGQLAYWHELDAGFQGRRPL